MLFFCVAILLNDDKRIIVSEYNEVSKYTCHSLSRLYIQPYRIEQALCIHKSYPSRSIPSVEPAYCTEFNFLDFITETRTENQTIPV